MEHLAIIVKQLMENVLVSPNLVVIFVRNVRQDITTIPNANVRRNKIFYCVA
jgi:hypothetical protein